MKITITIESSDLKEAAKTLQGLANRLDVVTGPDPKKPLQPIVQPRIKKYPPLITPDEPEAETVSLDGKDDVEPVDPDIQPVPDPEETPLEAEQKKKKAWCRKFPDGCRNCGDNTKTHMGGGLCSTCYFIKPRP